MNTTLTPRGRRIATAVALTLIAAVGPLGATGADAAPRPKPPAFTVSGTGTWQIRPWVDDVVVNGTGLLTSGRERSTEVQVAAVVQTDDRTLPGPGECEAAFATMSVYGAARTDFTMVGDGEVCGAWAQPPTSVVTHVLTGRYEVYGDGTSPRRLVGVDGFYEVRLGGDGTASVFATDT